MPDKPLLDTLPVVEATPMANIIAEALRQCEDKLTAFCDVVVKVHDGEVSDVAITTKHRPRKRAKAAPRLTPKPLNDNEESGGYLAQMADKIEREHSNYLRKQGPKTGGEPT